MFLLIGIAYSFVYLLFQIKQLGIKNFILRPWKTPFNIWIDILFVSISILVTLIHQTYDP